MKLTTPKARFNYLTIDTPRAASEGSEPKYSVTLLIPKSDKEGVAKINQVIDEIINSNLDKLGKNGKPALNLKRPLRDGDIEREGNEAFEGMWFMNATSKFRPKLVDHNLSEILDVTEIKSGDYGKAALFGYAYSFNGNKGVSFGLNAIQKLEDGEALSTGGFNAAEEFGL